MARRELDEWFWQIGNELQRLSEEMSRTGPVLASSKFWEPKIDVFERTDHIMVKAEIAGVRGEEIQLHYLPDSHSLVIRGVRQDEEGFEPSQTGCYQLEIFYGEFAREVKLPNVELDVKGIRAQYRNGFLIAILPKAECEPTETEL